MEGGGKISEGVIAQWAAFMGHTGAKGAGDWGWEVCDASQAEGMTAAKKGGDMRRIVVFLKADRTMEHTYWL